MNELTTNMQPQCIGRHLIDLPKRFEPMFNLWASFMPASVRSESAAMIEPSIKGVGVTHETSFPRSVKLTPDETVIFAWIVFKSRADRDRVNAKVMKDPRLAKMMTPDAMPFDVKRMIYGGFKTLVAL